MTIGTRNRACVGKRRHGSKAAAYDQLDRLRRNYAAMRLSDMASLGWNVDPKDWTTPGAPAIETAVVDAVQPGSIVVLHDEGPNRGGTVDALDGIITALRAAGYEFVIPKSRPAPLDVTP